MGGSMGRAVGTGMFKAKIAIEEKCPIILLQVVHECRKE